jgi:hypothetical protein
MWFRDSPYVAWDLIVRVAPGATVEQTLADLTSARRPCPPRPSPSAASPVVIHARSFADDVVGDVRPAVLMLGGARC